MERQAKYQAANTGQPYFHGILLTFLLETEQHHLLSPQ